METIWSDRYRYRYSCTYRKFCNQIDFRGSFRCISIAIVIPSIVFVVSVSSLIFRGILSISNFEGNSVDMFGILISFVVEGPSTIVVMIAIGIVVVVIGSSMAILLRCPISVIGISFLLIFLIISSQESEIFSYCSVKMSGRTVLLMRGM